MASADPSVTPEVMTFLMEAGYYGQGICGLMCIRLWGGGGGGGGGDAAQM